MKLETIWAIYSERNGKLNDPEASITIPVQNLRKMLAQVYECGADDMRKQFKEAASSSMPPGFDSIFGKFK